MSKIYDYHPVMVFPWYIQEWEIYGMCGNTDGGPIETREYYSEDQDGDTPLRFGEILKPLIPDEDQRKSVVKAMESYLYEVSYGIVTDGEAEMFFNGEL